jgi:hypothetical protein
VYVRVLERAAQLLGGKTELAMRLNVPPRELERWLAGEGEVPLQAFLRAVDIVMSGAPRPGAVSESREIRNRSAALREAAARNIARSKQILQAVLSGTRSPGAPRPRTVLAFLEAKFEPAQGADMMDAAIGCALEGTGADRGNIQIAAPDGLRIVAQRGFHKPFLDFFQVVSHEGSACGVAMRHGCRIVVEDVRTDPIFAGTAGGAVMERAGALAVQSTPIVSSTGWMLGMLSTHYERPCRPSEHEFAVIDSIVRRTASWLEGERA